MIVDITGIILIPGNGGKDCPGNGLHYDENGNRTEWCCDECNYAICCYEPSLLEEPCERCDDPRCPRSPQNEDVNQPLSAEASPFTTHTT